MRILALDFGTKHIGVALSDPSQAIAMELDAFSPKEFWQEVAGFVREKDVERVLVGWPIGLQGQETEETKRVSLFVQKLQNKLKITIELVDERFTTDLAKRMRGGKGHHDSLVAQIMLQDYLDINNKNLK